ncbi:MAG TPA: response regulator [Chloroflexota bacterium]|jgi:two-component system KDP operon response regulator KdpE|nr:response regulator [Chloroflexota bacterium]
MSGRARLLAVDDEPGLLRTLRLTLTRHGLDVETAASGGEALRLVGQWHPDVILLDLGLPDLDGIEVVRHLRDRGSIVRIIVLSARGQDRDKVLALDLGADDYLTKPFSMDELLARIRVALRHLGPPSASSIQRFGDLTIDFARRQVWLADQEVRLSPIEWDLLKTLVAQEGRVLTHRTLLRQVWGDAYTAEEHYLHVYIANLRKKIEADPRHPRHLITEPGVGYRFRAG